MDVNELFRRLSYGELSNLSLGADGTGTVAADKQNNLIHFTNEALTQLYTRFVLKESEVVLKLASHITYYHLIARYAESNPTPTPGDTLYIQDSADEPFPDDVIRIMSVYDAYAREQVLNDRDNIKSLYTPQPHILQVPYPVEDEILAVLYQAKHSKLPYDVLTTCIELPLVLEAALTAYIGHLVYKNMNGQENAAKASEHLATYERICLDVEARDLVNTSNASTGTKFETRGFA